MRNAHVFGAKVVELVFVGANWFAIDLVFDKNELGTCRRARRRRGGGFLQNCTLRPEDAVRM